MFRRRRGEISVAVGKEEADLLRRLIAEYRTLLDAAGEPGDPIYARLFPSASLDDPDLDRQYRELASDSLDQHKRNTVEIATRSLGESGGWRSTLAEEEREAWLVLLADLRLAIGVRLAVTEETMGMPADPSDPEQWPLAVLHYLGALQESLVQACMGE